MEDSWLRVALAVLATWRVAHLLAYEDGPWDVLVSLRARLGNGLLGGMLDCFHCLSLWVAIPFALFVDTSALTAVVTWLALSGAACLIERLWRGPLMIQPIGNEGDTDGMLRPGPDGTADEQRAETVESERPAAGHIRAVR
jgi:hypothetical protein